MKTKKNINTMLLWIIGSIIITDWSVRCQEKLLSEESPFEVAGYFRGPKEGAPIPEFSYKIRAELLKKVGVRYGKISLDWKKIDKNGVYDWAWLDKVVEILQEHGLSPYGMIEILPKRKQRIGRQRIGKNVYIKESYRFRKEIGRYRKEKNYQIDIEAYKKFIKALVERYDGDGIADMPRLKNPMKYYEVIPEPMSPKYFEGTLEDYVKILKVSYPIIKGTNPKAKVLLGSIADPTYLPVDLETFHDNFDEIIELGAADYFDINNIHIYGGADLHEMISYYINAINKPLWITETGVPDKNQNQQITDICSPAAQAREVVKIFVIALSYGVEKVFWFTLLDGPEDLESPWRNYGLFDFKFGQPPTPKPSFYTYKLMTSKLEGFKSVESLGEQSRSEGPVQIYF
jgi:hypothetical protein